MSKLQWPVGPNSSLVERWGHFLASGDPLSLDWLAGTDPGISQAVSKLEQLSQDQRARIAAQAREDALRWEAIAVAREVEKATLEAEARAAKMAVARGRDAGQREILQQVLETRFGELSDAVLEALRHASSDQLLAWTQRLFEADCAEDLIQ